VPSSIDACRNTHTIRAYKAAAWEVSFCTTSSEQATASCSTQQILLLPARIQSKARSAYPALHRGRVSVTCENLVSDHMAASLLGLHTSGGSGRGRRIHARSGGRRRSAAAVKQLLSRLSRSWRRRAVRPRRTAVRFGYDLHSYYQNFDDGHHRL